MAIASAVPGLIDALVPGARQALAAVEITGGVTVCDGIGDDNNGGNYLFVGAPDPFTDGLTEAAESTQEWASTDQRDETGTITCQAYGWTGSSGDVGQKIARDKVYAIANAFADWARENRLAYDLDVDELMWIGFGGRSQLLQVQDDEGSTARLTFQIEFRARL